MLDGGLGPDVVDGGEGTADNMSYAYRQASVTVDLASTLANQGEIGEGDRIAGGIEGARGGDVTRHPVRERRQQPPRR